MNEMIQRASKALTVYLAAALSLSALPAQAFTPFPKVAIVGCYDGDTCTTSTGEKIRLACIDAPEMTGLSGMSAGPYARNKLLNLVLNREVGIQRFGKDRYGRTVAELYAPPLGYSASALMLRGGWARVYQRYAHNCPWAATVKPGVDMWMGIDW